MSVSTKEVLELKPKTILEIGPDNGIVSYMLRKAGIAVTTLDHDPSITADITASLVFMPVGQESFELVLCCQVLYIVAALNSSYFRNSHGKPDSVGSIPTHSIRA